MLAAIINAVQLAEDKHYCVETRLYPAAVSGLIGEASVKQLSISSNNRGGKELLGRKRRGGWSSRTLHEKPRGQFANNSDNTLSR